MLRRKLVVAAKIELVGIGNAATRTIVVSLGGVGRQDVIVFDKVQRLRGQPVGRNLIVREWIANGPPGVRRVRPRRRRVEDCRAQFGKISAAHFHGADGVIENDSAAFTPSLVVAEEEGLVLDYRTAGREPELVLLQNTLLGGRSVEKIASVQNVVAYEFEQRYVVVVCARPQLDADDPSPLTELGAERVRLHFEFLNGVGRRLHDYAVDPLVGRIDPVDKERRLRRAHTVEHDPGTSSQVSAASAGQSPWRQSGQLGEVAAVQGKIDNLLLTDDLSYSAGLGLQERRTSRNGDRFRYCADLEREIDPGHLVDLQLDGRARDRFESCQLHLHRVHRRNQEWNDVYSRIVRDSRLLYAHLNVGDGDLHTWYHRVTRVCDPSGDLSMLRV